MQVGDLLSVTKLDEAAGMALLQIEQQRYAMPTDELFYSDMDELVKAAQTALSKLSKKQKGTKWANALNLCCVNARQSMTNLEVILDAAK